MGVWHTLDAWTEIAPHRRIVLTGRWAAGTAALSLALAFDASLRELLTILTLCGIGADLVLHAWRYTLAIQGALLLSGLTPIAALLALRTAASREEMT